MGFMGTFYPGMKVNPLDLSPNYAGKFKISIYFLFVDLLKQKNCYELNRHIDGYNERNWSNNWNIVTLYCK